MHGLRAYESVTVCQIYIAYIYAKIIQAIFNLIPIQSVHE